MDKILIVDAPNLLMRSIYAMRSGSSFQGQGAFTGPLVLFVKTLSYHVRRIEPNHLVVCWEGGKSAFRTTEFGAYKSNRSKEVHPLRDISFQLTRMFLQLSRLHQATCAGYEADDTIAALWKKHRSDKRVYILSADKDLLQLVDDGCVQIRLGSGGDPTLDWNETRVLEKFGCSREGLSTMMAIVGDSGDGIPGIRGLGPKKALRALEGHGWDLTDNTHPAIVAEREKVLLNHRLIDLRNSPELPSVEDQITTFEPTGVESPLYPSLRYFLEENELGGILSKVEKGDLWYK